MRVKAFTGVSGAAGRPVVSAVLRRWVLFYSVGFLGMLVQLSTLGILTRGLGLHYLLGTGLAVWVAILHNFLWHEKRTWADRARLDRSGRWRRLVHFHLSSGALSLTGNLFLMQLFVGYWDMGHAPACLFSIATCSILNFYASDRLVFSVAPGSSNAVGLSRLGLPVSSGNRTIHERTPS